MLLTLVGLKFVCVPKCGTGRHNDIISCACMCVFVCVCVCDFSPQAAALPMSIIIVGVGPAEFDGKCLSGGGGAFKLHGADPASVLLSMLGSQCVTVCEVH